MSAQEVEYVKAIVWSSIKLLKIFDRVLVLGKRRPPEVYIEIKDCIFSFKKWIQ